MNRIDFEETSVLDLFSGTGSISFEFVSRGCPRLLAVDNDSGCLKFIKETSAKLNIKEISTTKAEVFSFLNQISGKFDLIFADPPYTLETITELPDAIFAAKVLADDGLLIVEHSPRVDFSTHPFFTEHRNYGKVNFSFFESK